MLQDEVDYLREKADQATRLQATVDSFKKKSSELNSQIEKVREVEDQLEREKINREDEQRKAKSYKNQATNAKQQLAELQAKFQDENRQKDKLIEDLRLANERAKVSEAAAERLQAELLSQKEINEELWYQTTRLD